MQIKVGDCINYKTREKDLIFQVISLSESKSKAKKWHGQCLMYELLICLLMFILITLLSRKSSETLLEQCGAVQELFFVDECIESTFQNIVGKVDVRYVKIATNKNHNFYNLFSHRFKFRTLRSIGKPKHLIQNQKKKEIGYTVQKCNDYFKFFF